MLDIAIIGGGPAGLSAALYALRGGARVKLFEELYTGGQIVRTHSVENYPGMSDAPDGVTLGMRLFEHAERMGLDPEYASVTALAMAPGSMTLTLSSGEKETAKAVILCMGAAPRKLGLPREEALTGAGVSYCATCDGAFYRGKTVAVIGGGDTAVSDALYLSQLCREVYIIHRRDALRAAQSLQDAALASENVHVLWDTVVTALEGETHLTGLTLQNVKTQQTRQLAVDGVFAAVGIVPRTELVGDRLLLEKDGSIRTDEHMATSVPGVFAAGDIRHTPLRQVVTACADGAVAATSALAFCQRA